MGKIPKVIGLISRFGLTGLVNTGVGFLTAASLDVGLHVAPALANTAGYLVGVPVSFVLNRTFVFKHRESISATMPKYLASVALAFTMNQLVLHLAGAALGPGADQHIAAQLCGMATYTGVNLLICRFWVFPAQAPA
jgi:putative flippase GtrA